MEMKITTMNRMDKASFTRLHLKPMVMTLDNDVINVEYCVHEPSKEEYIYIYYGKPESPTRFAVCVTANSNLAIVQDVLKRWFK